MYLTIGSADFYVIELKCLKIKWFMRLFVLLEESLIWNLCLWDLFASEVDTSSVGTSLVVLDSESPTFKLNSSTPDCSFSDPAISRKLPFGVLLST